MKVSISILALATLFVCSSELAYSMPINFSDNFNDGNSDGWIFASRDGRVSDPTSSWSVVDGRLLESSGYDGQFALAEDLQLSSQTIEVQVDILAYAGICLWYRDLNNYVAIGSYPSGAALYVGEFFDGIAYGATYPTSGGQSAWVDFRVEANSTTGTFDFFRDGEYLFTHAVQTTSRTGLFGLLGGNGGGYFDNFSVTSTEPSPVPEPCTMLLLCSGLLGLVGLGRRRR